MTCEECGSRHNNKKSCVCDSCNLIDIQSTEPIAVDQTLDEKIKELLSVYS